MRARPAGLVACLSVILAACGSSGGSTPGAAASAAGSNPPSVAPVSAPPPSALATPGPSKGPATATFDLAGTAGLTGPVTITRISCGLPSLAGPEIEALGTAGTNGPGFVLFVSADHIEARVGTGAAQTLKLRTFVGSGVTSFDAAVGAQLDSALAESTAPGTAVGDLGALSHISGTLDCGNQQAGTASIVISGTSSLGPMSGQLSGARVTCTILASGTYVTAQALTMAGSTPVLIFVNASPAMLQLVIETASASDVYSAKGASASTISSTGAQFSTDLTETVKAGATPLVLHIEGNDTCGTTLSQ